MKHSWWKVPLYCAIASFAAFELEVRFLLRFALYTTEDGYVTNDPARELIVYGAVFAAIVLIGGLVFFRRMTRREIALSACVLAVLNVVFGLLLEGRTGTAALMSAYLGGWDDFPAMALMRLGLGNWVSAIITWVLIPFIFVLFGRKSPRMQRSEGE